MSNMSQEEESQASVHRRQPPGGSYGAPPRAVPAGGTAAKRRRSLPGNPDPDAEVIALSPRSLVATNRYVCEVCHKGFQRDQNLQLHRRGHNLPWKLKQRGGGGGEARKRVYVCPEASCVHHHPRRALGDLTGIKKHFSRKHGEKRWKCATCSKRYAVHSDWKAHSKICGTKLYRCDCATLFSRKDSFITHRAFCDALLDQTYRADGGDRREEQPRPITTANPATDDDGDPLRRSLALPPLPPTSSSVIQLTGGSSCSAAGNYDPNTACFVDLMISAGGNSGHHPAAVAAAAACMSATALLQKAAEMGAKTSDDDDSISHILFRGFTAHQHNNTAAGAGPSSAAAQLPAAVATAADLDPAAFRPQGMVGSSSSNSPPALNEPGDRRPRFISTQRGVQRAAAAASKQTAGGMIDGIRTTQDFMGLGCMEGPSAGRRRRHGISAAADDGLAGSFDDGQQKEDLGVDSYHLPQQHRQLTLDESTDHQSAILGRPIIWNY